MSRGFRVVYMASSKFRSALNTRLYLCFTPQSRRIASHHVASRDRRRGALILAALCLFFPRRNFRASRRIVESSSLLSLSLSIYLPRSPFLFFRYRPVNHFRQMVPRKPQTRRHRYVWRRWSAGGRTSDRRGCGEIIGASERARGTGVWWCIIRGNLGNDIRTLIRQRTIIWSVRARLSRSTDGGRACKFEKRPTRSGLNLVTPFSVRS